MSKLNGYAVIAKIGSDGSEVKIPGQTDSSIQFDTQTEDVTTKDSEVDPTTGHLFPEEEITSVSATISVTCLKDATTKNSVKIGSEVNWAFASGGDTYSGKGIVTSLKESGSVTGKASMDITIKSKGAITGIA